MATKATIPKILERLAQGESMNAICKDSDMPDRETVRRWADKDEELAAAITRAREDGFELRADKAVEDAKNATDAQLARLAFDADRWYLGKLSNAFRDKGLLDTGQDGASKVTVQIEYI